MRYSLILAALALGGCVHVAETHLPDGNMGYTVECRHSSNCYNKAAELCHGPYKVLSGNTSTTGIITSGNAVATPGGAVGSSVSAPVNRTSMLVECQ
jgi:hypothetical protein